MKSAKAALVTSGTATLETALFNTPEVVCYKGSSISVAIAKRLIKVKYISLVNLIMDKELVKELIQEEFTVANCTIELNKLLNPENSEKLRSGFAELKAILGNKGASQKTSRIIYELAQSNI
jgi:lipid-A-disaccharide synthase